MYYSVCVPAVLGREKEEEALSIVAEAGFGHYEIWSWWDKKVDVYKKVQQEKQLSMAALCTKFIPLTDPSGRRAYVEGLEETAEVCRTLGCKTIITQVGQEFEGVPGKLQHASIVAGLRECLPVLKEKELTLVIEPLNTKIDHPGYYLWQSKEAFQIIDEVGDEHVKVLFDLYHQHIMDDLVVEEIVKNIDKIGHFHMAGYPGRHEPLIDCEIDYPRILKAIRESGYSGGIGLEYVPVRDAAEGLRILCPQLKKI